MILNKSTILAFICAPLFLVRALIPSSEGIAKTGCLKGRIESLNREVKEVTTSRRKFWSQSAHIIAFGSSFLKVASPANAATAAYPQANSDREKILKGYDRLSYLIDNWVKETTICGTNDNPYIGCERNPVKVMGYLGYKSTDDPLFKAEKTLMRLQALVSQDDIVDYLDAVELYLEKADEGSGTAYVSSWGEANPGGGKDRVDFFIERAKKDVIEARDSLGKIIEILKIKE